MVISLRLNNEQLLKISPIAKKANKSIPAWVRDAALKAAENINNDNGIFTGILNENDFFQIREILLEELEPLKNNSVNNFIEEIKMPVESAEPVEPIKDWADYELEIADLKTKVSELDKENDQLSKTIDTLEDDCKGMLEYELINMIEKVLIKYEGDEERMKEHILKYNNLISEAEKDKRASRLTDEDLLRNIFLNGLERTALNSSFLANTDSIFREDTNY
jgi:molybdopterin converting factor small subunit